MRLGLAFLLLATGCSGGVEAVPEDTGVFDSGRTDSSTIDSAVDSSSVDSAKVDSSPVDSSSSDSATVDSAIVDSATDSVTTDGSKTCTPTSGCDSTEYCDAPTCSTGTCKPRPTAATLQDPVCGCDGVTYWNASYAQSLGRSITATKGACSTGAATCGGLGVKKCPNTGDKCIMSYDSVGSCAISDPMGVCWSVPTGATCPAVLFNDRSVCGSGGFGKCISTCDAIKNGAPFYRDSSCPV